MKQRQQIEEQELTGFSYEEILSSWENHNQLTAKVFVLALCDALRRKHPLFTNKNIQTQVSKDVLNRGLCTKQTLAHYWPDWVTREYHKKPKPQV